MLNTILQTISGEISHTTCEVLYQLAKNLPSGSTILDINCGEGLSAMVLAAALESRDNGGMVIAADSHIQNLITETPYQDGTVMRFLTSLTRLRLSHRVVPIVASVSSLRAVVNKRSANMVVVQSPMTLRGKFFPDSFLEAVGMARYAARNHCIIAVCCPDEFDLANQLQQKEYKPLLSQPGIRVFEAV